MDCLFCKIAEGTIPSRKVYEDDAAVAFYDIQPQAPVHLLVIPRKHISSLDAAEPGDAAVLGHSMLVAQRIARDAGLAEDGYRVVTNSGPNAGQIVFHLHLHVLGGEKLARLGSDREASKGE